MSQKELDINMTPIVSLTHATPVVELTAERSPRIPRIKNPLDPKPLVDNLGSNRNQPSGKTSQVNAEVMAIIEGAARFRVTLTEGEITDQYFRRAKLLRLLNLKPFTPTTEEVFEDWVDDAACEITRFGLCVGIFQEALSMMVPKAGLREKIGFDQSPRNA